jgi:ankyrin repeat protein
MSERIEPVSDLPSAISAGDIAAIRAAITAGADVNAVDPTSHLTPLLYAIRFAESPRRDEQEIVQLLLDLGADPNVECDRYGKRTPLDGACRNGLSTTASLLVARGADTRWKNEHGFTILHVAALGGIDWLVQQLLDQGFDVNLADDRGQMPLHGAIYGGHIALCRLLIERGADVNARVQSGDFADYTPLHLAVDAGFPQITALLLDAGALASAQPLPLLKLLNWLGFGKPEREIQQEAMRLLLDDKRSTLHPSPYFDDQYVRTAHVWLEREPSVPDLVRQQAKQRLETLNELALEDAIEDGDAERFAELLDVYDRAEEKPRLMDAVDSGSLALVQLMIVHGADVNEYDSDFGTPLHSAAQSGYLAIARALVDAGADVDIWSEPEGQHEPETPLSIAAERGDTAFVQLLLEAGASVALDGPEDMFIGTHGVGIVPLYRAKDPQVVALLLDRGSDPSAILSLPSSGFYDAVHDVEDQLVTRLEAAIDDVEVEVVRLLLERGGPFRNDGSGDSELRRALEQDDTTITALLLAHGARLNTPEDLPEHLTQDQRRLLLAAEIALPPAKTLLEAIEAGDLATVRRFLDEGADLRVPENTWEAPLICAIRAGQQEIAEELIARGAPSGGADDYGALYFACMEGMASLVRHFLREGADLSKTYSGDGTTLLHIAARRGHTDVVVLLLDAGMSVDLENARRETPLYEASSWVQVDTIRLLIERMADPILSNSSRTTIIGQVFGGYAKRSITYERCVAAVEALLKAGARLGDLPKVMAEGKRPELLRYLLERGHLDLSEREQGSAVLGAAAYAGDLETVQLVLNHSVAGLNTALLLAAERGHSEIARLLLAHGASVNARNEQGKTSFDVAHNRPMRDLLRFAGGQRGRQER